MSIGQHTPCQLTVWRERFCFIELVWLVGDFLDFFLAWWDFDDLFFFVLVVGADGVAVSGAIVCPPLVVVWASDWIGNVVPATKVSKANAETSAFIRELLDRNNGSSFFSHL
jgi:hypothetical protein